MTNLMTIQRAAKSARDVARGVVGHHSLDAPDAVAGEEATRAFEEIYRRQAPLIRQHLRVSQTRGIVDGDVDDS